MDRGAWWAAVSGVAKSQTQLNDFHFHGETKGFPGGASAKEPACQRMRTKRGGLIPGSRRFPGGGNGNPLQYSCLENPMDRGAWYAAVHGVAKSWTQLND